MKRLEAVVKEETNMLEATYPSVGEILMVQRDLLLRKNWNDNLIRKRKNLMKQR